MKGTRISTATILVILMVLFAIAATVYVYFTSIQYYVGFEDSFSRMNIARRMIDNLTPGLAQLGGVWLPLPQLFLLPFVSVEGIYRSGLAGMVVSLPAYIAGGYFLYRLLYGLSQNRLLSFTGTMLYAANPNILYMQTTAMSESLFLCALICTAYLFFRWSEKKDILYLVFLAAPVVLATLTRYEGYMLCIIAIAVVAAYTVFTSKRFSTAEGMTIIFMTSSTIGIIFWLLYSFLIFNDPFNWLNIYTGAKPVVSSLKVVPTGTWGSTLEIVDPSIVVRQLLEVFLLMSGWIISLFACIAGYLYLVHIFQLPDKRAVLREAGVFFILLSPLLFLFFSAFRGSIILEIPPIGLDTLFDPQFHRNSEYNIRYGMLSIPLIILLTAIGSNLTAVSRTLFYCVAVLQILFSYFGPVTGIYNFPRHFAAISNDVRMNNQSVVSWFRQNFDGDLVMISAGSNDFLMYELGIPQNRYIFEGTGDYWETAIESPVEYAAWIIMRRFDDYEGLTANTDLVRYHLEDNPQLKLFYDKVYEADSYVIYKRN